MTQGGPIIPVAVSTDAPTGEPALRVTGSAAFTMPSGTQGGPAVPVVIITDAQTQAGYPVQGNAPVPMALATDGRPTTGQKPIAVYLVSGTLALTYQQRVLNTQPATMLAYWPMSDTSGTVMRDVSANARNGAYKASGEPLLGQAGVNAGEVAPLFDGTNDYANAYSASLAGAFNGAEGALSLYIAPTLAALTDGTQRLFAYFAVDGNNRLIFQKDTANKLSIDYRAGGTVKNYTAAAALASTAWLHILLTWSKSRDVVDWYVGGVRVNTASSLGTWAGSLATTTTNFGAQTTSGNLPWAGRLAHAAVWSSWRNAGEAAYLAQKDTLIIFEGDSQTIGSVGSVTPYPTQLMALGTAPAAGWLNVATSGQTITTMISDGAGQVDVQQSPLLRRNIVVLWGGTNDISAGADAATVWGRLLTYTQARQAAGWSVVLCTLIAGQVIAGYNTIRNAVNVLIRNNAATYGYTVADLAADSRIGDDGDENDTTYFNADKIHLVNAGYAVVAGIVVTRL